MGLGIALRAFSAGLFDRQAAEKIRTLLDGNDVAAIEQKAPVESVQQAPPPKPNRSDAVTLLSALQREARLIDLVQEDLSSFDDAQVGAAARPCLQQSAQTLQRFFDLKPVADAADGSQIEVEPNASPARYQWAGEGTGTSGSLIHHGWQASKVELPKYNGAADDAFVVAPAQVQRI